MKSFLDETFYTPEDVAHKLKLSLTTVYNLIKSKEIPAVRIGKSFRIAESELSHLLRRENPIIPPSAAYLVEELVKSALRKKITDVILFGSYARGEAGKNSDIDILILYSNLTSQEKEELLAIEEKAAKRAGYLDEMNVMKKSALQWQILKNNKSGIYKTITHDGLSLWKK